LYGLRPGLSRSCSRGDNHDAEREGKHSTPVETSFHEASSVKMG
jgi:hypothetical protein